MLKAVALFLVLTAAFASTHKPLSTADAVNNPKITSLVSDKSSGPAVIRAQILLCRAKFSVGEIDGSPGLNFRHAVMGFQAFHKLAPTGVINQATWKALNLDTAPAIVPYRITAADLAGPFEKIPGDLMEQAKLTTLGYESVDEELGERFHSNPAFLHSLNPRVKFDQAGTEIMVPNVGTPSRGHAASVTVSKSEGTITALDASGKVLAQYPGTTGSEHDPLPLGDWKVTTIHHNPTFSYNPELFWDADSAQAKAKIAAGPRNPVGVVWIGISKEHYGLHGTPAPNLVGHAQSHGCVRLTNWDALELAKMLAPGAPVHFKE